MKKDFVKELGYMGFATRLKRISDNLMHEGRRYYNDLDVDIEPNWYAVFKLLNAYGSLSVTDISDYLKLSHPSVIAITNKMEKAGYLNSIKSSVDSRKRLLTLSERAIVKLPEYEIIWDAATTGIANALEDTGALEILDQIEERLSEKGFQQRAFESLTHK